MTEEQKRILRSHIKKIEFNLNLLGTDYNLPAFLVNFETLRTQDPPFHLLKYDHEVIAAVHFLYGVAFIKNKTIPELLKEINS